ncbi:MAG: hypothetical protein ACE5GU_13730 [Candidatus Scalinduaceae bacterium]
MGELGDGVGSSYPGALDTNTKKEVNTPNPGRTKARAEVPNDLADAIIKIETELGVNPAMGKTDMLTYLQTEHTNSGSHSEDKVITLSGVQGFFDDKTFNSNIIMGSGYTVDGIDLSTEAITKSGAQTMTGQKSFDANIKMKIGDSNSYSEGIIGRAYVDINQTNNTGAVNIETLKTYSLPANSLNSGGDTIEIKAWGEFLGTGGRKETFLYFGNQQLHKFNDTAANDFFYESYVTQSGTANAQVGITTVLRGVSGASYNVANNTPGIAEDITLPIDISVKASGNTADVIKLYGLTVNYAGR